MIIYQNKKPIEFIGNNCVGITGDNLNYTQDFFIKGVCDNSISYTIHLRFADGSVNSIVPDDMSIDSEGTKISWTIKENDIFMHGYFEVQIEGKNDSGLIFQTEIVSLYADESLSIEDNAYENPNSETLRLREESYAALEEIKNQQAKIENNVELINQTDLNAQLKLKYNYKNLGVLSAKPARFEPQTIYTGIVNGFSSKLGYEDDSTKLSFVGFSMLDNVAGGVDSYTDLWILSDGSMWLTSSKSFKRIGEIPDGSITSDKLASELQSLISEKAQRTETEMLANKVTSIADITDESINYSSVKYLKNYYYDFDEVDALLADKLDNADGSVKTENIAAKSVTSEKLSDEVKSLIDGAITDLNWLTEITTNPYMEPASVPVTDFSAEYSGQYFNSSGALAEYSSYASVVYFVDDDCTLTITSQNGASKSIVRVLQYNEEPPTTVGVSPATTPTILVNNVTSYTVDVKKGKYIAIDYVTSNGLKVSKNTSIVSRERKSDDEIRVKYKSNGFLILYPSKSGNYIGYLYGLYTMADVNVNVWRLKNIYVYDENLNPLYLLCSDSYDCEGVLKIDGETDYIGSVHGDEQFITVKLLIDGKEHSTSDDIDIWCKNVTFAVSSNVYEQDSSNLAFTKEKLTVFDKNGVTVSNKWKAINPYMLVHVRSCLLSVNKYSEDTKLIDYYYDSHKQLIPQAVPEVTSTASILYSDKNINDAYIVGDVVSAELHAIERSGNSNIGMINDMGSRIKPYIDCYVNSSVSAGDEIYCKSRFKYTTK